MSRQSDFLRDGRVLRLATNEEAGPHVAPVWYLYDSGLFYIGTNSKTRKVRNIERDGRVGFSIDVGINSPDIYGVAGQGRAAVLRDSRVKEIGRRILLRYFEDMAVPAAQELLDDTDCIVVVTPERTWKWEY
jgi:nitroimidazol reductase NimA-like FMN-containing flavoprotein (pyridoxamine 5'-phosphate oxidase superfamily)